MPRLSPRRLRWRLTLSYTLVTTAVVLGLEIVLFAWLLNTLFRTELLPSRLASELLDRASELQLVSGGDDLTSVEAQAWFDGLATRGSWRVIDELSLTYFIDPTDPAETWMMIVDEAGRVLGGTPGQPVGASGGSLADTAEARQVLQAALAGSTDRSELYGREPNGTMVAAAPVYDLAGGLQGALVVWTYMEPGMGLGTWAAIIAATLLPSACLVLPLAVMISLPFGYLTARGLVHRLEAMAGASEAWSRGDFSPRTGDRANDELGQLSRRLDDMAGQLQTLLAERREMAIVEERNRLALELHDSVKQQAFAVSAQLAAARSTLGSDSAVAVERLAQVERQMDELRQELANLILELRPPTLEGRDLAPALQEYIARWTQQSNIQARLEVIGEPQPGAIEVEQDLFRIAQEALANVARHSAAQHVDLRLVWRTASVMLTIRDDGRGFDPAHVAPGVGLRSMRERAVAVNGTLSIESTPGGGTCISVRCPM